MAVGKPSPIRLVILLAVLVALAGALIYDYGVAAPGVEKANDTLETAVYAHNARGFDAKTIDEKNQQVADSLFDNADVQKVIGKTPARTITEADHTIEVYRWWGYLPLSRHYMTVMYHGPAGKLRYRAHYVNEMPPAEAFPDYVPEAGEVPPEMAAADTQSPGPGMMAGPGGKGGKGGGKGGKGGKGKGGGGIPGESPPDENVRPPAESTPSEIATDQPAKDDAAAKETKKPAEGTPPEEKPAADKLNDKSDEPGEKKGDAPQDEKENKAEEAPEKAKDE